MEWGWYEVGIVICLCIAWCAFWYPVFRLLGAKFWNGQR